MNVKNDRYYLCMARLFRLTSILSTRHQVVPFACLMCAMCLNLPMCFPYNKNSHILISIFRVVLAGPVSAPILRGFLPTSVSDDLETTSLCIGDFGRAKVYFRCSHYRWAQYFCEHFIVAYLNFGFLLLYPINQSRYIVCVM